MITCMVVDDEQHAIDLLTSYIDKVPGLQLSLGTTNSIAAFQHVQKNAIDLIYLDIHMPELDGIQFLKLLGGKSKVILTTAYSEYALEGYEHDVLDYLIKPILFERFLKATQKAINATQKAIEGSPITELEDDYLFFRHDIRNKIIKIKLNEILFIEGMGNYVAFYLNDSKIVILATLTEIEEKLSSRAFFRVHKSYIIPLGMIDAVEGNQVVIGKNKIPLGETYKEAFFKAIGSKIFVSKK